MLPTCTRNIKALHAVAMAILLSGFTPITVGAEQALQQIPLTLKAADLLPGTMLSGDGYRVNDKVVNDGFQNTYTLKTDYGDYSVIGNAALAARIQEVRATRSLEEIERSDAFKDAVKGTAEGMVEGGKALVTSPVETTKGAVKGVGRWLGNVGRSITGDDPHQDNALKTALGHDAVKRGYAIEMGVDPYTDFEPFQKRLGEVARAATAGGLVMSLGTDMATQGTMAGTVVTVTSVAGMKEILKDKPPSTLAKINREKLEKMGIDSVAIDALLKNYNYTPTEMTVMVEALRRMGNIKGREIFVAHATAAPDKIIARYMQQQAEMIANYNTGTSKGDFIDLASEPWLMTRNGTLIGMFPIDYLAWTPELSMDAKLASEELDSESGAKGKELWIEGQADPVARKALESRGWMVKENVRLASSTKTGGAGGKSSVSSGAVGAGKVAPTP